LALLQLLLSQAGRPVSKEAILASVWPDTHVLPDNIKVLIREIRLALGERSRGPSRPRFIRCEPTRGYAFVAPLLDDGTRAAGSHSGAGRHLPGSAPASTWAAPAAPPFVNRGPELALLADAFDAARAGQRRFVLLQGERGIGKSALAAAGLRTARTVGALRAGSGQCVLHAAHQGESFAPLLDVLHRLCRQYPAEVPPVLAQHAPDWLAQIPEWAPGQPLTTRPVGRQTLLIQLSRAVTHLAADLPLVVLLGDLEWADDDTRVALTYLASRPEPAKLLVICTGNAFVTMGRRWPLPFTHSTGVSIVDVTPLVRAHVDRYLDMRFGPGTVSELGVTVHSASRGNPSLMVGCVDALVADGLIARVGGRWQTCASKSAIHSKIHETMSAPLVRVLEALDQESLGILRMAAADGAEFAISSVASALGRSRRWLRERLWVLAQQGLVTPTDRPTLLQVERFRFCFPQQAELLRRRTVVRNQRCDFIMPVPDRDPAAAQIA
jgi:hypothetical protein